MYPNQLTGYTIYLNASHARCAADKHTEYIVTGSACETFCHSLMPVYDVFSYVTDAGRLNGSDPCRCGHSEDCTLVPGPYHTYCAQPGVGELGS